MYIQENHEAGTSGSSAGVVSKQDLDQARATIDAAQAQLHSLEAQVSEQQVQLHYYQVVPRAPASSAMFPSALATASSPPPHLPPLTVPAASKRTSMYPSRNLPS